MPERDVEKQDLHKILILRFSSLGDIVMATPMIRCVRKHFPKAQIDMVVRSDFLELIKHNPHLDRRIGLPREKGTVALRKLLGDLQKEGYDLVYDAHRSLRTRILMPWLQTKHKAYYQKQYVKRSLALTFKLPLLAESPRMLNRYLFPLKPFGVKWDGLGPEVFLSDQTKSDAFNRLPEKVRTSPLVGLIPSAQWEGKRWPAAYFRKVTRRIVDSTDQHVLIFGGKKDFFCQDIAEGFSSLRVTNLQGKVSIGEAAALLQMCTYAIANDTGLMHLADAVDTPCVLILGPTSEEMGCLPFHPKSKLMEQNLWCRPCSKNGQAPCIRSKRYCLENTTPEMVFDAAQSLAQSIGMS